MGDLTPVAFLHSDFLQCAQANGRTLRRAKSVYSLDVDKEPAKGVRKVVVRDNNATKRYVVSTINAEIATMKADMAALRQEYDSRLKEQRQGSDSRFKEQRKEYDSRLKEQRQEYDSRFKEQDSRLKEVEVWLRSGRLAH